MTTLTRREKIVDVQKFPMVIEPWPLERVVDEGNYVYCHPHIPWSAGTPAVRIEEDAYIIQYGDDLATKVRLHLLETEGYCPANIFEVALFGRQYPHAGCKYPIVALGQQIKDHMEQLSVVVLWEQLRGRMLDLFAYERRWLSVFRDLAFKLELE